MSVDYHAHWLAAEREEEVRNEQARLDALEVAGHLARILVREYGAKRVLAFGSVTQAGAFNEHSDIDLGVEDLPPDRFFQAMGRLIMESRQPVDLKPIESVPLGLRKRIEEGVVLHEAG